MSTINKEKKTADCDSTNKKKDERPNTFSGNVVSMIGNTLVMRNNEGKEFSHRLAADATLTCDGVACEAVNLKAGNQIRVTTKLGDRSVATCVDALDKKSEFAECCN